MKFLTLIALLSLASFEFSVRGEDKAESVSVDGTWRPISAEFAGAPFPDEVLKTMKLILEKEKYTVFVGENPDEGTVSRNPKKSPKTMDITGTKGPNKGKTFLAIYELKDGNLRVCYDLSGKAHHRVRFATKDATIPGHLPEGETLIAGW